MSMMSRIRLNNSDELKRVLPAPQPTELEQNAFSDESCCVRTLV